MSYRPITDMWILARPKLKEGKKYYGAYLGGFPERARVLIGCTMGDSVLHVCGGMAKYYPYKRAIGERDVTMDIDPAVNPDIVGDAEVSIPNANPPHIKAYTETWDGILIDPPYSPEDAKHYGTGSYPNPRTLLANALKVVRPGGKVGIIHYIIPRPPVGSIFVAVVGVFCGFDNRIRAFSVFERPL